MRPRVPRCAPGRARPTHVSPAFQPLEPRIVMTALAWDGGGGNALWSNPLNWSLNFVPRQVDDVTINLSGAQRTIIADLPVIKVNSLTLNETLIVNSGTTLSSIGPLDLGQNSDLRINGAVNWAAGTWSSGNTIRLNAGGLLNIGSSAFPTIGAVTLRSPLDNAGRLAWRGGDLALGTDGSITNRAGKAMDIASPLSMTGTGHVTNHGLLRRGGNTFDTTTINVGFENTDRFYLLRGTVQIGEDPASPHATIGGRLAMLDISSTLHVIAPATYSDEVQFTGRGSLTFSESEQVFLGDALLGANNVLFEGPSGGMEIPIRIAAASTLRTNPSTDLRFELARITLQAPLVLDGEATFLDTLISDAGIPSAPLLTLDGDFVASTLALAVYSAITQNSTIEIGRQVLGPGGASISFGYAMSNQGTLTYNLGTFVIGVGAQLLNEASGTLILTGPTVGGGPGAGPVINQGTLIRRQAPNGNGTTSISGTLNSTGVVNVEAGVLNLANTVTQLPAVPAGQLTILTAGTWQVRDFARLNLPQPLEVIGVNARVELFDQAALPAMIAFNENRGVLLMTGFGPGVSGPGPTIVNKGTIQLEGHAFSLRVFTTPVEQRSSGRIIIKNGTLQMHGVSGATRDFANPGLVRVEAGTFSLALDDGGIQGTFINTGTLDVRKQGTVTIVGALNTSGTYQTELSSIARGNITATRNVLLSGTLTATYVGTGFFQFFNSSIILSGSFTVAGAFQTFHRINVPSPFTALLLTQFGVSIRLE